MISITSSQQQDVDSNLQVADADVSGANPVPVVLTGDAWTPLLISEETADDSDKSFTVPANRQYQYLSVWVELTTTADAGNRQITIEIQDAAADVIGQVRAGIVQAASLTRYYMFSPPLGDLVGFRDTNYLMTPLPMIVLPATYILRVYDSAAIAAGADDMIVQIMVAQRTV